MCGMVWLRMPRPVSETSRVTCPSTRAARNADGRAGRRVDERVVEQDPHHLRHALGSQSISIGSRAGVHLERRVVLARRRRELARDVARELRRRRSAPAAAPARPTPGGRGRAARWRACASGRPGRGSARGTARASPRRAPRPRAARGSRRARRSACAARARRWAMNCLRARSQPRELALHVVERGGELAELVVGVDVDRVGEVAGRDLARGALEPLDAARQRARDEVAAEHGERRARPRRRRASGGGSDPTFAFTSRELVGEHRDAADLLVAVSSGAASAWRPTAVCCDGRDRLARDQRRAPRRRRSASRRRDAARVGVGDRDHRWSSPCSPSSVGHLARSRAVAASSVAGSMSFCRVEVDRGRSIGRSRPARRLRAA